MAEVEDVCDRVVFVHHGRVVAEGTPLAVSRQVLGSDALDAASMEEVFLKISRGGNGMSRRVGALLLRYLLLIRRDYSRVVDLVYWPLLDITVWGLFTFFLWRAQFQVPNAWRCCWAARSCGTSSCARPRTSASRFLDDVWARSVVTVFASPLTFGEFGVSVMLVGLVKVVMSLAVMGVAAWLLYAFDLLTHRLGARAVRRPTSCSSDGRSDWWRSPSSCASAGRWQILAWSLPFVAMPLSCVFYPAGGAAAGAAADRVARCRRRTSSRGCARCCSRTASPVDAAGLGDRAQPRLPGARRGARRLGAPHRARARAASEDPLTLRAHALRAI